MINNIIQSYPNIFLKINKDMECSYVTVALHSLSSRNTILE